MPDQPNKGRGIRTRALRNTTYATIIAGGLLGLGAPAAHADTTASATSSVAAVKVVAPGRTTVTATAHGTTVTVHWVKVAGATDYVVTVNTSQSGVGTETRGTSATFTKLAPGAAYTATVSPRNAAGTGPAASVAVTTAPGKTRVSARVGTSTATAAWAAAPGATAYRVTLKRGSRTVVAFTTHARSTTFSHLQRHTAYTVVIIPVNAAGDGGSTAVTATTR